MIAPGEAARTYWLDLWRYRELLYFLAWRDVVVRYKQTAIGIGWALLRPALTMLVFVAFRRMTRIAASSAPEPIFVFAAVLPWQFFSTALTDAAGSLIANTNLISKIYFPRLIIPWAAVATAFVDFLITLPLLGLLMAWYGFAPGWHLLALPLFTVMVFVLSFGSGVLLATLNVKYRDFRYVVPFIVQFGLFVSPIAFTTDSVPSGWRWLLTINPMSGIINGFRWSILAGGMALEADAIVVAVVVTALMLLVGVRHFRRMERTFADLI